MAEQKTLRSTELGAITALGGAGVSIAFTASGVAVAGNTVSVPVAVAGVVEAGVGLALTGYGMNSVGENFAKFTESLGGNKGNTLTKVTINLGNEIDITPSSNHTTVTKNPGPIGTPIQVWIY